MLRDGLERAFSPATAAAGGEPYPEPFTPSAASSRDVDLRVDLSTWVALGGLLAAPVRNAAAAAEAAKLRGNSLFGEGAHAEALDEYSAALDLLPEDKIFDEPKAIYLGNRAACFTHMGDWAAAVEDCHAALTVKPKYPKVLLRRATALEKLDKLDEALLDFEAVLVLEPRNTAAIASKARVQALVNERNEKLKNEMLDKLKGFGNTILGKFGLSLDNFKMQQDPSTGSYSINFKQ